MRDVADFVLGIACSGGLLAAAWLIRNWLGARIKGEVESVYAKDLESHRAELRTQTEKELEKFRQGIEQERTIRTVATGALAAAQVAAAERRLKAVQEIWVAVLESRNGTNRLLGLLDIHMKAELAKALDDPRREESIGSPTHESIMEVFSKSSSTETARPFIDEPLWALFFGYRALLGRILFTLQSGRERGSLRYWLDDRHARMLLASLVEPLELQAVERLQVGAIFETQRLIEGRIAEAARKSVNGEAVSAAALQRARAILEEAKREPPEGGPSA